MLKQAKRVYAFVPNDIRLSFYIAPLGDVSLKTSLSKQDLASIYSIINQPVNPSLFDQNIYEAGNIDFLFAEKVIDQTATGEDLDIYSKVYSNTKYKQPINKHTTKNLNTINNFDDYAFSHCILAESNPLYYNETKVINTFRGYLEVKDAEFSILRRCNNISNQVYEVFIPNYYVKKYQLRNGDEIICSYIEYNGIMLLDSLFSINQISYHSWNILRPSINELNRVKTKAIKSNGDYLQSIINKFNLYKGDCVDVYLAKTSIKDKVLGQLVDELDSSFDKIVYINTHNQPVFEETKYNIAQFCIPNNTDDKFKITIILLAIQYVRRLIELGKNVVIIIDDIEYIIEIDKEYNTQMPILNTLLGTIKTTTKGSCTTFSLISLKNRSIKSLKLHNLIRGTETLGIMVDNNEIDLFNSYRI